MGTFFIGVDFGTVHTKVCVREDVSDRPRAVVLNADAIGGNQFLFSSVPPEWRDPAPPKVILCGRDGLDSALEHRALVAAIRAVAHGVRAAIALVDRTEVGRHEFILQLGLPTEDGVMVDAARHRYFLLAEAALREIGDKRARFSRQLLDERLATLALLDKAKLQLGTEPILVVDGGGWTTHVSFLRWVSNLAGVSIHGDSTAKHGIHGVVRRIATSIAVDEGDAARALHDVMQSVYANARHERVPLPVPQGDVPAVEAGYARLSGRTPAEAQRIVGESLRALGVFVGHHRLRDAWQAAWVGGWSASPGSRHYATYRLLLAGGAARIGRNATTRKDGPMATQLWQWQGNSGTPFTGTIYPELDRRFWSFDPVPPSEAVPYLFVAGGYTHPHIDWPRQLKRTVLQMVEAPAVLRTCHCSGLSDSCPACAGAGYVKPDVRERRTNEARNVAVAHVPEAPVVRVCPHCLEDVVSSRELEHFTDRHWCGACGAVVPNLRMHRAEAHPVRPTIVKPPRLRFEKPQPRAPPVRSTAPAEPTSPRPPSVAPSKREPSRRRPAGGARTSAPAKPSARARRQTKSPVDPKKPLTHNPFAKLAPRSR